MHTKQNFPEENFLVRISESMPYGKLYEKMYPASILRIQIRGFSRDKEAYCQLYAVDKKGDDHKESALLEILYTDLYYYFGEKAERLSKSQPQKYYHPDLVREYANASFNPMGKSTLEEALERVKNLIVKRAGCDVLKIECGYSKNYRKLTREELQEHSKIKALLTQKPQRGYQLLENWNNRQYLFEYGSSFWLIKWGTTA